MRQTPPLPAAAALLVLSALALPARAWGAPPPTAVDAAPTWADREVLRLGALLEAEAARPRALRHVMGLQDLVGEVSDLPRLRDTLLAASRDRRIHAEARALARLALAEVEWRRGRRPRAQRWIDTLQVATAGRVVGPFENEGGAGFAAVYPPEAAEIAGRAPDLDAELPGKGHPVRWRVLPALAPLGFVDLSDAVSPAGESVVYVRFVLESARDQAVYLRLGTSGASKLWLDGQLVDEDPADHPARFDQRVVPVRVTRGTHTLLLKIAAREGRLGYWLRASDAEGDGLRGVRFLAPAADRVEASEQPRAAPERALRRIRVSPADTLLARLAADAGRRGAPAAQVADHAWALARRHPFDRTDRAALVEARRAAGLASGRVAADADVHYLAGILEDDDNRRRAALERAVEIDPDHLQARLALGQHHLARDLARDALPHLRRAVAAAPDHLGAQLALGQAESRAGFPEDERARLEREVLARHPLAPRALDQAAGLARAQGRLLEVRDRLRVAVSLYPGDRAFRAGLASVLLELGDLDGGLSELARAAEFQPGWLWPRLRRAELLSANGRRAEAAAAFGDARRLAPDDPQVHLALARDALRRDDRDAAMEAVAHARMLQPQDAEVAELLRVLSEDGDDFWAPWRRDLAQAVADAEGRAPEGEDVWTLADVTVVKVHKNGLQSRVQQQIHQALTQGGVERLRSFSIPYTPGEQNLRILRARVRKPDGTVLQARSETERSLSEPWYRLYYDRRARVVSFPDLAAGDVVEITWRLDDVSAENMFGDYFGDFAYLQGTRPVAHAAYVLLGPPGRKFFYNQPALAGIEHAETRGTDGGRVLTWIARDVPKVVPEPGMPGWSEVAAFLHVSTFESWDDVAAWWWRLSRSQLVPGPELRRLAQELVRDLPEGDVRGRVAALHNYVVRSTRYVGLEFGIHGYKPYQVDQIHDRRFGDCKDKASLMYALMESVGIDAEPVLLRMRRLGRLPDYPASLAVFNHAILYVPALDLYLDGTAEFAGTGELPTEDRGAAAVVVDPEAPDRSRFLHVPYEQPDGNVSDTELRFALTPAGDAMAEGRLSITGSAAAGYRQAYQAADDRAHRFEQSWAGTFPGASVRTLEMNGLADLERPITATWRMEVPRLASPSAQGLRLLPFGDGQSYTERYAPLSVRRQDLVLGYPFTSRFRYAVSLPDGWREGAIPEAVEVDGRHGRFRLSWTREGAEVIAAGELVVATSRIPAAEYPDFRRFLGEVDRAVQRPLRLVPAAEADARPEPAPSAPEASRARTAHP